VTAFPEKSVKDKVRRYYQATTEDYLKYYSADWHQHMHYGFERDLPPGGNPTENMVRYLADCAGIKAGNSVLDAGCGVGGSSIWLARHRQARSFGLNLMAFQAALARNFAGTSGALFMAGDFMEPPVKAETFDTVWAIESFDHAPDKAAWIRIMATKLRSGGCIALADGFRREGAFAARDEGAYKAFLEGWAVPHLCTAQAVHDFATHAGLHVERDEDITADVMPHAFAIFRFAFLFVPGRWVLRKLGLTSDEKLLNARATWHQYRTLKRGLWSYRVFILRKP
jgi:tocopherol O-methyltransferase